MIDIRREDVFLIINDFDVDKHTIEKIERILEYYDDVTLIDWSIEVKTESYDDIEAQRYSPDYPNLYNAFNYLITKDYEEPCFIELSMLISVGVKQGSEDSEIIQIGDMEE